eukprot:TRINITY_DN2641_c0_g1_i2.p1 TRINITY_DN2641_c0_g1~~TRINITY_DN2641_c0_g1_i2.p1  ORF type:complete len:920 (+),score=176.76 TRINITY_DN2641_c0_g1_i2:169-2760(+)
MTPAPAGSPGSGSTSTATLTSTLPTSTATRTLTPAPGSPGSGSTTTVTLTATLPTTTATRTATPAPGSPGSGSTTTVTLTGTLPTSTATVTRTMTPAPAGSPGSGTTTTATFTATLPTSTATRTATPAPGSPGSGSTTTVTLTGTLPTSTATVTRTVTRTLTPAPAGSPGSGATTTATFTATLPTTTATRTATPAPGSPGSGSTTTVTVTGTLPTYTATVTRTVTPAAGGSAGSGSTATATFTSTLPTSTETATSSGRTLTATSTLTRSATRTPAAAGGSTSTATATATFSRSATLPSESRTASRAATTTLPTGSTSASRTATLTAATPAPTAAPTAAPTVAPTGAPTAAVTAAPTGAPTAAPTAAPTGAPSASPSSGPSPLPTPVPTPAGTTAADRTPTVVTVALSMTVSTFSYSSFTSIILSVLTTRTSVSFTLVVVHWVCPRGVAPPGAGCISGASVLSTGRRLRLLQSDSIDVHFEAQSDSYASLTADQKGALQTQTTAALAEAEAAGDSTLAQLPVVSGSIAASTATYTDSGSSGGSGDVPWWSHGHTDRNAADYYGNPHADSRPRLAGLWQHNMVVLAGGLCVVIAVVFVMLGGPARLCGERSAERGGLGASSPSAGSCSPFGTATPAAGPRQGERSPIEMSPQCGSPRSAAERVSGNPLEQILAASSDPAAAQTPRYSDGGDSEASLDSNGFRVGERVVAQYIDEQWYTAWVAGVGADGYVLKWADGSSSHSVPAEQLKHAQHFKVGDRVEAYFHDGWYEGVIEAEGPQTGDFNVRWKNGATNQVRENDVRRPLRCSPFAEPLDSLRRTGSGSIAAPAAAAPTMTFEPDCADGAMSDVSNMSDSGVAPQVPSAAKR